MKVLNQDRTFVANYNKFEKDTTGIRGYRGSSKKYDLLGLYAHEEHRDFVFDQLCSLYNVNRIYVMPTVEEVSAMILNKVNELEDFPPATSVSDMELGKYLLQFFRNHPDVLLWKRQDIWIYTKGKFGKAKYLDVALSLLVVSGYISMSITPRSMSGVGRKGQSINIHDKVFM